MSLLLQSESPSISAADPEFNALVCQVAEELESGRPVDLAALRAARPEHAERLERLLPMLEAMAALGQSDATSRTWLRDSMSANSSGVGADVLGEFRIIREIGRGGMGVVYEAEQIPLMRRVALKVLPFAAVLSDVQLERFRHEARAAAALKHPHIVSIYSVGCDRGVHYYAMQLVDGQSLAELIQELRSGSSARVDRAGQTKTWPKSELADTHANSQFELNGNASSATASATATNSQTHSPDYFRSVACLGIDAAEALQHAHQLGVLHRDVKPANLLLDHAGKLWITDFGLARTDAGAGLTMTGDLVGTLRYMSPEQILADGVVDCRTDVYSLGVTLYELATLEPAFHSPSRGRILHDIVFDRVRSPRSVNSHVPAALDAIIVKATERNPAHRYASAADSARDLRQFLENLPTVARRPWLRRLPRRPWALVAIAWLLLLPLACAALLVLIRDKHGNEKARIRADEGDRVEIVQAPDDAKARETSSSPAAPASSGRRETSESPELASTASAEPKDPKQIQDALALQPDQPSGKFEVFAPAWSDEAASGLTWALAQDSASASATRISDLSRINADDSAVAIIAMDRPGFLRIGAYSPDKLKRRKVIGIGVGAAKLFSELGLLINDGACAHGVFGPPRIKLEPNRLIGDSLFEGPVFVFEPPVLDEKTFHNDLFFGMYIGDHHPQRPDLVEYIAIQTADKNYAPIVRQGNKVLICIDAPADKWSASLTSLVRKIAVALDSQKPSDHLDASASQASDVAK